jgi:hypothetical protein
VGPPPRPLGQGRLKLAERLAVEERAMQLASKWCKGNGWPIVKDVRHHVPWDLEARKRTNGAPLFVEVKGSTGEAITVEVTVAEVRHAQAHPKATALVVVSDITLKRSKNGPIASGGRVQPRFPWVPSQSELSPVLFRWKPLNGA